MMIVMALRILRTQTARGWRAGPTYARTVTNASWMDSVIPTAKTARRPTTRVTRIAVGWTVGRASPASTATAISTARRTAVSKASANPERAELERTMKRALLHSLTALILVSPAW